MSGGGSKGGGGGGGSSGQVRWPGYYEAAQKKMLTDGIGSPDSKVSVMNAVARAWETNPYAAVVAFDPSAELDEIEDRLDDFDALTRFDPDALYAEAVTRARTFVEQVYGSAPTEQAVQAFEQRQRPTRARATARLAAAMADIGAHNSSAFAIGMALLENDFAGEVARFRSDLEMQTFGQRAQQVFAQADAMVRLFVQKIEINRAAAALYGELKRVAIVAQREYVDSEIDLAAKDGTWELGIFQYAANVLSAGQGGSMSPDANERKETSGLSSIGGAISGAASLALVAATGGAAAPVVMGAAALGGIGGFMGGQ